jgi:hypothetical protein
MYGEKLHQFNLSDFGDITPTFPTLGVTDAIREHHFARTAIDRMQAEWERKRVMRGEAANYQRGRR